MEVATCSDVNCFKDSTTGGFIDLTSPLDINSLMTETISSTVSITDTDHVLKEKEDGSTRERHSTAIFCKDYKPIEDEVFDFDIPEEFLNISLNPIGSASTESDSFDLDAFLGIKKPPIITTTTSQITQEDTTTSPPDSSGSTVNTKDTSASSQACNSGAGSVTVLGEVSLPLHVEESETISLTERKRHNTFTKEEETSDVNVTENINSTDKNGINQFNEDTPVIKADVEAPVFKNKVNNNERQGSEEELNVSSSSDVVLQKSSSDLGSSKLNESSSSSISQVSVSSTCSNVSSNNTVTLESKLVKPKLAPMKKTLNSRLTKQTLLPSKPTTSNATSIVTRKSIKVPHTRTLSGGKESKISILPKNPSRSTTSVVEVTNRQQKKTEQTKLQYKPVTKSIGVARQKPVSAINKRVTSGTQREVMSATQREVASATQKLPGSIKTSIGAVKSNPDTKYSRVPTRKGSFKNPQPSRIAQTKKDSTKTVGVVKSETTLDGTVTPTSKLQSTPITDHAPSPRRHTISTPTTVIASPLQYSLKSTSFKDDDTQSRNITFTKEEQDKQKTISTPPNPKGKRRSLIPTPRGKDMAGSIDPSPIPYNLDDEDPLKSSESLPVLKKATQPPRLRKGLAPPKVEAKKLKGGVKCQLKPPATKIEVGGIKDGPIKSQRTVPIDDNYDAEFEKKLLSQVAAATKPKVVHSPIDKENLPATPHSKWSPIRRKPLPQGDEYIRCTKYTYKE